ncbi:MAG: TIGR03013 family PEP-CTERM/XrtA system glycosyltransferase [Xanthomonadaceae bacterium]|nr:TIGR03013 family PEP-CTERM/XrtA system glycosyltransferase [Xanthomonadaceae bacterium]
MPANPVDRSPILASRGQMRLGLLRRLMRQQSLRSFVLLAGIEIGLLLLAPWVAARIRFPGDAASLSAAMESIAITSVLFAATVWLSMVTLGLYQRHSHDLPNVSSGTLVRLVLSVAAGSLALMVLYSAMPGYSMGWEIYMFSIFFAFLLLLVSRFAFASLSGGNALRRRVLLVGSDSTSRADVADTLARNHCNRVSIVGIVPPEQTIGRSSPAPIGQRHPEQSGSLLDLAFERQIDDIVVTTNDLRNCLSMDELMSCRLAGISVFRLDTFYERELGRVMLEGLRPSWFVFTNHFDRSVMRRFSKRAFDLAAAAMVFALAWPVMLLVALVIWIECKGREPVLYRQERVGEGDCIFTLYKFRSMRSDAESDGVARWASTDDNRVTRVGHFVRKFRLDELPQLYNVLRGDMSMVGPRPERPEIVAQLKQQIPYYGLRHSVAPGLSGWAQLRYPYGASVKDAEEKLRYDLYYIKEQNMLFDLEILLQTAEVVLFRRGSR